MSKHIVNQGLEDSGGVGQAKGRHHVLRMHCRCVKSCLTLIPFLDADQMVSLSSGQSGRLSVEELVNRKLDDRAEWREQESQMIVIRRDTHTASMGWSGRKSGVDYGTSNPKGMRS